MKNFFMTAVAVGAVVMMTACSGNEAPKEEALSVKLVKSEMNRLGSPFCMDYHNYAQKGPKWDYCFGLEQQAMMMVAEQYPEMQESVYGFVRQYLDTMLVGDGTIVKYKMTNYTLDHINPGKLVFMALDKWGDAKFKMACDTLYTQLTKHPRVSEGGFWHKLRYPNQMWLDGIYMEAPFYAQYAQRFLEGDVQKAAFADVWNQFAVVAKHTYDPANGLYRHAFDESKEMAWASKEDGRAPHVWGRALGWYTMAMVDVMDFMPAEYGDSIKSLLQPLCENLLKIQQPDLTWQQVLDQTGREGNYNEISCTAMFAYTFMKGAKLGLLPKEYWQRGYDIMKSVSENYIEEDVDDQGNKTGNLSLTRICGVAGLGGEPYRSGDYDYYIHEIIRNNDPKGISPFIMALLMVEKYGANMPK